MLNTELEIVKAAKAVISAHNGKYIRKYCTILKNDGRPTGKRSHKFYWLYNLDIPMNDLIDELNAEIFFINPAYAAFKVLPSSRFGGLSSISIRPIKTA